jgi:hypothetical protein
MGVLKLISLLDNLAAKRPAENVARLLLDGFA